MPIMIIVTRNAVPAIVSKENEDDLLAFLSTIKDVPEEASKSIANAQEWLQSLPPPSGIYPNEEIAKEASDRVSMERNAALMKAALEKTGLTQAAMAEALGLADPRRDGSAVRKILLAKTGMSGALKRCLAYILVNGVMTREQERAALDDLEKGKWRQVKRSQIRRISPPLA